MRKLTFAQTLWLSLYLSLACLAALTGFHALSSRDVRVAAPHIAVADDADQFEHLASDRAAFEKQAVLTREAAQTSTLEPIKGLRFGQDGDDTLLTDEPEISQTDWPTLQNAALRVRAAGARSPAEGALAFRLPVDVRLPCRTARRIVAHEIGEVEVS
jgi:hypothetical protein